MRAALAAIAVGFTLLASAPASAVPAFARKTGMGCPACHESWPKLNDFGEAFRDRGYRVGSGADDLWSRPLDYFPVAFRTTLAYQYSLATHQATDGGDRTVGSGSFVFPGADLIFGASLHEHFSVFAIATGFSKDGGVHLESAWGRLNQLGTPWLNFKLGRLELDLPVSEHRSYTLTMPFLVYHYHPMNSANAYSMGDNQLGIEVMGHGAGAGLRYSLALLSADTPGSAAPLSAPVVYGHLTYTVLPRSRVVGRVRAGAFGDVGFWPTQFAMLTPLGGMAAPVPGTGTDHKTFWHAGAELHCLFGAIARPLSLSAVWLYGQEEAGLIANGTRDARFHGGFVEIDYTPLLAATLFVRFDGVFNARQADVMQPANSNQQIAFTGGARHALILSAWGSIAAHVEVSTIETQNAAMVGMQPVAVRTTVVFAGLDFGI